MTHKSSARKIVGHPQIAIVSGISSSDCYLQCVVNHLARFVDEGKCSVWAVTRAVYNGLSDADKKLVTKDGAVPLGPLWFKVKTALKQRGVSTPVGQTAGNRIRAQLSDKQWQTIEHTDYRDPLARGRVTNTFKLFGKKPAAKKQTAKAA